MITILRSFGNVVGAEWTAVFWAVWLFLYLTVCLLFRRGRRLWIIGCGFLPVKFCVTERGWPIFIRKGFTGIPVLQVWGY